MKEYIKVEIYTSVLILVVICVFLLKHKLINLYLDMKNRFYTTLNFEVFILQHLDQIIYITPKKRVFYD